MNELKDKIKFKYPEINFEIIENIKIPYILKQQKWIPLEVLGIILGFKTPRITSAMIFSRNKNKLKKYSALVKLKINIKNNRYKRTEIHYIRCLNYQGVYLFLKIYKKNLNLLNIFEKLLNVR